MRWRWAMVAAVIAPLVASGCSGGGRRAVAPTTTGVFSQTRSTATTVARWQSRMIVTSGTEEDLAPAGQALYWLDLPSPGFSGDPVMVSAVRYDLSTNALDTGASLVGLVGPEALTVTGGWVWVVLGQGSHTIAEQLNPEDLVLHAAHTLGESGSTSYPPWPVLSATAGGPLFIAAGEDLWAVDPVSGAVDYHLTTTDQIAWMSTDPTGRLLYVVSSAVNQDGGETVSQYDIRTGQLLRSTDQAGAVNAGTAAATSGGVWLSYRGGMAGSAFELSSSGFQFISPAIQGFGTFEQIMGVESGVSEGVLWLTSGAGLTCADPNEGAVRAAEPVQVADPVASGHVLYAQEPGGGVIAISPPRLCWG